MKLLSFILFFVIVASSSFGQNTKIKEFDRKKWNELVNEVKKKRYDKKEIYEQSNSSTENEYNDLESDNFNSESESNDGGIYNEESTSNDEIFFDENKDQIGKDEGKNPWNEDDLGDLDPKYEDGENDGNNTGYGNEDNGKYNSYNDKSSRDNYYTKDNPSSRNNYNNSSSSGSASGGGDSTWLLIIMIVILAVAVAYMILVSFSEKNKKVTPIVTDENKFENLTISKSELELALEAAIKNKNYREAVRIYFIAVIKEMKDKSWIRWEKKKTNYHYINEISGRQQQPDFITATRAFEIVWYGNRSLAENEYHQIEPLFKKLLKSIHS